MNLQKFTTIKAILFAFALTITTSQLFAQTTNGIFFQAVARDNFSNPAKDRQIYVVSSIIQSTATGTKVLVELHKTNTDAMGVFNISLGNGTRTGGSASSLGNVDWSKGPFFLNLKIAITPFSASDSWDYTKELMDMGTTSFGTVPFALYSASSAKVDNKLDASDTTVMLKAYAKAVKVQSLETAVASKLTAADTLTMLAPYAKVAYTIDSSFFKSQLATKLSLSDTIYYTKQNYIDSAIAKKLNIADSAIYVTKSQLASYNFSTGGGGVTVDTSSLSKRINLKANNEDLDSLTTTVSTKLNIKDTANLLKKIDTASLSSRINLKIDASKIGVANGVASLNASGTIPSSQLPPVSISSTSVVSSDVDMAALSSATVGSIAIRTDLNKNYILSALPASTLANWVELLTPAAPVQTVNGYTGSINLSKIDIDLSNVNNTSDLNKPISTKTQSALDLKLDANKVGAKSGVASLNAQGKIPTDQIPSISFSSVKVLASQAEMLALTDAVVGSVVIRTDLNKNFVLAQAKPTILANWIELLTPAPPVQSVNGKLGNVAITKTDLDLENVNNTTDANKPVSTAAQTALDAKADTAVVNPTLLLKAPLASPKFTGSVAIGTTTPSSSAVLDITSTSQGLLLPRLTYVQKTAIVNPVAGLILFCSDCGTSGEMQLYNGTSFVNMIGATAQFAIPAINSTTGVYSITTSTATSGGVINSDGGAAVTARGIVWGTSTGPTTALSTKTTDGTGVGTFTSSMTGLISGVTYYVRAYATNSMGTKYGPEISFNSSQSVATLAATTPVSAIGSTTATSGGNITYNGGATVTVSGVVWSTTSMPTIALATKTTNGAATGAYTSTITGLTPGTLYYIRSYATNSVGTSYGAQISFTTLNIPTINATASATLITSNSATTGGTITADGGAAVTARGIVYGTSSRSSTFSVTTGTGTGTYTISLTGLNPATTYYVRSFATNSVGTVYGTETIFTTIAIAPTLTTTAASSITKYAASAGGTISSNGGSTITASGICWGTTATPSISDFKTTDGTTTGTFTSALTGLTAGTTYYVRAYATNAIGTSYGAAQSFTTLSTSSNNPVLASTTSATSITANSAMLVGNVTDEGATEVSVRGLVYGTSTGASTFSVTVGLGAGTFTSTLTGLTQGATYYVRSFATNVQGTAYGAETSFTTQNTPIVSVTATPSSLTTTSAISGGTISSTGGATITTSGLVWGASINPTISLSTKTTDGLTSGTFTSSITGLTQGATYHVRAYATNYLGTSYGPGIIFTTLTTPAISGTASATSITSSSATTGGTITADGGATVTSRGLFYGTSTGSATYSATSGTGTGTYTISLTGLTPATTYYVRSFATNSVGTVYGIETSFTTIAIAPTLTTNAISSITKYTSSAGGTITSNGGSTITASGICWSTTATPTISDSKTTDGTISGTFTSSLTGLTAGTTYYVRAYATNTIGTSYGATQSFTTLSTPPSQTTVLIGTQTWSDKNLNVSTYRNGDAITYAANATQWAAANAAGIGAYTYLKYASGDGGATYGKLYNWYAVNDARGLAPTGYHIPTKAEWTTLRGTQPGNGKTLKSNTSDWSASFNNVNNYITFTPDANYSNYNGTNSTGFNALPGGSLFPNGTNGNYGSASYWTATIDAGNSAKANWTYFHPTFLYDGFDCCGTYELGNGMSVRLVKDNNLVESSPTNPILASTTSAISITANSAILGGNVTDEGATQVSVRGLVYGTSTGASTFSVTIGSGAGTFTGTLTGLTQGTTYFVRSFATNVQGTSYGAETSFTTQTTPTVSTTSIPTSVTSISALGGGIISSTGGATITTSGLVWSLAVNPTTALATKTTNGATSGTFTSSITGLTQGTTYHVRAYATNSVGTSYGPDITFTTLTTPTVSATATITSITGTTATGGGTISSDGGATVTTRGVVWGTTTGSSTYSATSGIGTGSYVSNLSGLSIATTYYVRAFATNSVGTSYGPEITFTTLNIPTISSTTDASSITGSSAISGGTITSDGGAAVLSRGIVWGASAGSSTYSVTTGSGTGIFASSLTGLARSTNYFVRAFATNIAGTVYGPEINFTTIGVEAPVLANTKAASRIGPNTASVGATITSDGGGSIISSGVCWNTTGTPTIADSKTSDGSGATFSSSIAGLSENTTYYVRSYATNSAGTSYGTQISFSTYGTVTTRTGKIWLDRNLGASRVAQSATDAQAYGDYFEWGRPADGHEKMQISGTSADFTSVKSSTSVPINSKFIKSTDGSNDWLVTADNTLWTGANPANNPCPVGFRIPTESEFYAESVNFTANNASGSFEANFGLRLTMPGVANASTLGPNAWQIAPGNFGQYLTQTAYNDGRVKYFGVNSSNTWTDANYYKIHGQSVRCIKNY